MDVYEFEGQTGCRFSWNILPPSRVEAQKIEIPIGCLFTPLKETTTLQLVEYDPVRSRLGNTILNPFCSVDFKSKTWACPFTYQRNNFPPSYADHISEQNLPAELVYPVVEYILPAPQDTPSALTFVLLVDTCVYEEELREVVDSLQQVISLLPPDTRIGLVTFGTHVNVYDLKSSGCTKSYVFHGNKNVTIEAVQQQLGLLRKDAIGASRNSPFASEAENPFIAYVGDCEYALSSILDDLRIDPWPIPPDNRAKRCVGSALTVAMALLESLNCAAFGARITLLLGGICTYGPGKIAELALSRSIRQHIDLAKEKEVAKQSKKAEKFYVELASRACQQGYAVDIFACSLDQSGLHEMRVLAYRTGGCLVLADSFSMNVFKDSFRKLFESDASGYMPHAYDVRIDLICSKNITVCGALGPVVSQNRKNPSVSDLVVGEGNTVSWRSSFMDKNTTIAFYFEMGQQKSVQSSATGGQTLLQFQTFYLHPSGRRRLRVSTIALKVGDTNILDYAPGFDQEAAAVLIARLAVMKTAEDNITDVMRWLDRKLIRFVSKFADYQKNEPTTFHLTTEFAIYPQFMYHLRRSHFIQTFNTSPDETAYYRTILMRLNTISSLVSIQPALLEYTFENGATPVPVLLDSASLKPNSILLLDSFFHVVIWHGQTIQHWRDLGYQDNPEYQNFAQLLQAPVEDAKAILEDRFPVPKYVQCSAGGSQARFLLAKVNPSTTYATFGEPGLPSGVDESVIHTDDVSLKVFMEHLIKLAVQS